MWIAQHDRKHWATTCKINVKVNDKFCYLMVFNIKSWIKPWNVILIIFPNYPTFLFVPKKWKSMFLKKKSWMANFSLIIHFNSFLDIFLSHDSYACLLSTTIFFYNKWSTISWSKSLKTCNFEDCPKLNLNFNNNNFSFLIQFIFLNWNI